MGDESKTERHLDLSSVLEDLVGTVFVVQLDKHALQSNGDITVRGRHAATHWAKLGILHQLLTVTSGVDKYWEPAKHGALCKITDTKCAKEQMATLVAAHPFMARVSGWAPSYDFGTCASIDVISKCATIGITESFLAAVKLAMDARDEKRWIAVAADDVQFTEEGAAALSAALQDIPCDVDVLQLAANCLTKFGCVPVAIEGSPHWCRVRFGTGALMYLIRVPKDGSLPPFVQRVQAGVEEEGGAIDPVDVVLQHFSAHGRVAAPRFGCITSFADVVDADGRAMTSSDTVGMPVNFDAALASGRWRMFVTDSKLSAEFADAVHQFVIRRPRVGVKKHVVNKGLRQLLKRKFGLNNVANAGDADVTEDVKALLAHIRATETVVESM